jgi:nucleotide-binding universal stress UspA family protein
MRIKKILCPLDYSDCSINALKYAAEVASRFEAKLLLVHALDNAELYSEQKIKQLKTEHIEKISMLIDQIPEVANKMTDIKISGKKPKEAILQTSDTFDIDLIVMGTEGTEGLFDELIGSFTYSVISESQCPVLIVPNLSFFVPYQKIGFGVDYNIIDHTSALDILIDFAYAFNAKIEVFHIAKENKPKKILAKYESSKLDEYFSGINHDFCDIESSSFEQGVEQYIDGFGPDLLAIMPRKHNFFERITHKSTAKKLVNHIKLPILTFPEK